MQICPAQHGRGLQNSLVTEQDTAASAGGTKIDVMTGNTSAAMPIFRITVLRDARICSCPFCLTSNPAFDSLREVGQTRTCIFSHLWLSRAILAACAKSASRPSLACLLKCCITARVAARLRKRPECTQGLQNGFGLEAQPGSRSYQAFTSASSSDRALSAFLIWCLSA
jgi:hypothetical protein